MSELKVNKISPRSGTDVTLGDSGDTFTIPAGATITNNGTANGFDTDTNDKVKVSSNDTTAGFLNGKLVAGTNITLTEGSDGGDETLTIASAAQAITATANGADNRIATYSAASTLNGEANLTFDGSTLALTGNMTVSGTVDGQDVAAVATTASAALPKAGGTMTGDIDLGDNVKATFGNGEDLIIFHDATDSIIKEQGGGDLIIRGEATIKIQNEDGSETYANFKHNDSVELFTNGTKVFQTLSGGVEVLGLLRATGDITAFYSSDKNLKTNIENISNPMDKVMELNGVSYNWTEDAQKKFEHFGVEKEIGVIAQDVEKVLPEIVAQREDGTKAVRYERICSLLIECVKDLQEQVNELKKDR